MTKFSVGDRVFHFKWGLAVVEKIEYLDRHLEEQWYLIKLDVIPLAGTNLWSALESSLTFVQYGVRAIGLKVCRL